MFQNGIYIITSNIRINIIFIISSVASKLPTDDMNKFILTYSLKEITFFDV